MFGATYQNRCLWFQSHKRHGNRIEIKSEDLTFNGSKLFSEITDHSNNGYLVISQQKVPATLKLWLEQEEKKRTESFDDIHGLISMGSKYLSFEGTACSKLFNFNYKQTSENLDFTIRLCYDQ